jgi:anti-sigma B factor antagonist
MQLTIETRHGVTVVILPAIPLDFNFAPELKRDLDPRLEASPRIVLDMGRVVFLDSSGLGILVRCMTRARAGRGDLKLAGLAPSIRSVMKTVRMDQVFDIHETADQAVESFLQRAGTGDGAQGRQPG